MEFISCQLEILGIMTIRLLLKRTGLTMRMKGGDYIVSVGDSRYSDYPTYIKTKGKGKKYADERRRLYKIRHEKTRGVVGSASWYADKLLW